MIIIIIAVIYSTGKEVSFNGHIIVFFTQTQKYELHYLASWCLWRLGWRVSTGVNRDPFYMNINISRSLVLLL